MLKRVFDLLFTLTIVALIVTIGSILFSSHEQKPKQGTIQESESADLSREDQQKQDAPNILVKKLKQARFEYEASKDQANISKETDEEKRIELISQNSLNRFSYSQLTSESDKELYITIVHALEGFQDVAHNVSSDKARMFEIFKMVLVDYPDFFWVTPQFVFITNTINGVPTSYDLEFTYAYHDIEQIGRIQTLIDRKVTSIRDSIGEYDNDFEKTKGVYEYLLENTIYDTQSNDQSMYDVMVEGRGSFVGYAKSFHYILNKLGIQATVVTGTLLYQNNSASYTYNAAVSLPAEYTWNLVKIDDTWYHVDVASGEILSSENGLSHALLLLSSDEISKTHRLDDSVHIPEDKSSVKKDTLAAKAALLSFKEKLQQARLAKENEELTQFELTRERSSKRYAYAQLTSPSDQDLYVKIVIALENFHPIAYNVPSDMQNASEIFELVLIDYPEFFWVSPQMAFITHTLNGEPTNYDLQLYYTYRDAEQIQRDQTLLDRKMKSIADLIGDSDNDFDTAMGVYTYLIENTVYDDSVNDQSLYSVMLEGKGVCAGYAKSFQYIMHKMGVHATIVTGDLRQPHSSSASLPVGHAWNLVKIDTVWYHVDVTSGDALSSTNDVSYEFFLLSSDEISKTHRIESMLRIP